MRQEVTVLAQLSHSNIVSLLGKVCIVVGIALYMGVCRRVSAANVYCVGAGSHGQSIWYIGQEIGDH